ncbi:hypothetical protein RFI_28523 [Reticulomyxa filosa]|uniref:Cyclin-like domain-containing protein n=1 Tax=Reticulomyxa filosa TaxID=46433 RepID=X6M4G8_RETFI|nr:hypothetical protein RFI_28523 [Reticulomyxa filosa]|eukprot:ETO08863.1 hypothetical protein RFI_28523 [Reticulomyxa filosa]
MAEEGNAMDMGFFTSTHFRRWLFKDVKTVSAVRLEKFRKITPYLQQFAQQSNKKWKELSDKEYELWLESLQRKIVQICQVFSLPIYTAATAVMYFKRFYLKYCLYQIDGPVMVCTAIFLATKAEQTVIDITTISEYTKTDMKRITDQEIILLDGIRFDLKIWHPFRPLRVTFDLPLRRDAHTKLETFPCLLNDFEANFKKMKKIKMVPQCLHNLIQSQCNEIFYQCMVSDVALLYPPSQIALSVFLLACSNLRMETIAEEYFVDIEKDKHKQLIDSEKQMLKKSSVEYFNGLFGKHKHFEQLRHVTTQIQAMIIDCFDRHSEHKNDYKEVIQQCEKKMFRLQNYYNQIPEAIRNSFVALDAKSDSQIKTDVDEYAKNKKRKLDEMRSTDM